MSYTLRELISDELGSDVEVPYELTQKVWDFVAARLGEAVSTEAEQWRNDHLYDAEYGTQPDYPFGVYNGMRLAAQVLREGSG